VRVAQQMLLETNYDLKRIAADVGCASLQHFSVLFRNLTGQAPSAWRTLRR
jgi:transcriptional regulator GlxA family with amidase domain